MLVGNKSLMLSSPTLHTLEAMSHRRVQIWETLLLQQIVRIYILSIIQSEDHVHMYTVKRKAMIFAKVQSKKVSTESDTNYMTELGTFICLASKSRYVAITAFLFFPFDWMDAVISI